MRAFHASAVRIGLATMALVTSCAIVPARRPATTTVTTGASARQVTLRTDALAYPKASTEIQVGFTNDSPGPVYLAICGPWEIARPGDPDRPVWDILCEIDYLGHRIEAGSMLTSSLSLERTMIEPGTYVVQGYAYADCALGEPYRIDANETNYGKFGDCQTRMPVQSPPFTMEP